MADAIGRYARDLLARFEREGRIGYNERRCRQLVEQHLGAARCEAQARFGEGATVATEAWRGSILDSIARRSG